LLGWIVHSLGRNRRCVMLVDQIGCVRPVPSTYRKVLPNMKRYLLVLCTTHNISTLIHTYIHTYTPTHETIVAQNPEIITFKRTVTDVLSLVRSREYCQRRPFLHLPAHSLVERGSGQGMDCSVVSYRHPKGRRHHWPEDRKRSPTTGD
jgi:hypothetical protein